MKYTIGLNRRTGHAVVFKASSFLPFMRGVLAVATYTIRIGSKGSRRNVVNGKVFQNIIAKEVFRSSIILARARERSDNNVTGRIHGTCYCSNNKFRDLATFLTSRNISLLAD